MLSEQGIYDYGILSFSFLLEFNKKEQRNLLKHLNQIVKKNIFIDLPFNGSHTNGAFYQERIVLLKSEWGETQGYFPTENELLDYIRGTQFSFVEKTEYYCSNQKKRILYIFEKLPLPAP